MEIPHWIISPYGDIKKADDLLQEKLIGVSTIEEFKVQFRNANSSLLTYFLVIPYYGISNCFSIFIPGGKWFQRGCQSLNKKREQTGNH